ncbi:DNA topoisomerase 2-beta [Tyrophagus putrescentiae]|nr:DNA topoisomerase 2-beta [Tyrophagus putrescentiae]
MTYIHATSTDRQHCVLVLVEGKSALKFCRTGIAELGGEFYGGLALRGLITNVRYVKDGTKKAKEDQVLQSVVTAIGLTYGAKYEAEAERASLRYGKVLLAMDGDDYGIYQTGQLISYFQRFWPRLLEWGFLDMFLSPQKCSLGSIDPADARLIFAEMRDSGLHRIAVRPDTATHRSLDKAFSREKAEERKQWIKESLDRHSQGLPLPVPRLAAGSAQVTVSDFVEGELVHFFFADIGRNLPHLHDGLTSVQRKVVFTLLGSERKERRVAALAGVVADRCNYRHDLKGLKEAIALMAKDGLGCSNLPLLVSHSHDSVEARYSRVTLSPLVDALFPASLLTHQGQGIEPDHLAPIIPLQLVNGSSGKCAGYSTHIPMYDPRELVENTKRMLRGQTPTPMQPWYRRFTGTIKRVSRSYFIANGEGASTIFGQSSRFSAVWTAIGLTGIVHQPKSAEELFDLWFNGRKQFIEQQSEAEPFVDDEPPAAVGGGDEPAVVDDELPAAVGGGDEPAVVEDDPAVEPGLVAPRPVIRGVCPECGERFRDNGKQQEHWWRDHAGVLPFICSYPGQELAGRDEWCGHIALTKWTLERHVKDIHPGGKTMAKAVVVDIRLLDTFPDEGEKKTIVGGGGDGGDGRPLNDDKDLDKRRDQHLTVVELTGHRRRRPVFKKHDSTGLPASIGKKGYQKGGGGGGYQNGYQKNLLIQKELHRCNGFSVVDEHIATTSPFCTPKAQNQQQRYSPNPKSANSNTANNFTNGKASDSAMQLFKRGKQQQPVKKKRSTSGDVGKRRTSSVDVMGGGSGKNNNGGSKTEKSEKM